MQWFAKRIFYEERYKNRKKQEKSTNYSSIFLKIAQYLNKKWCSKLLKFDTIFSIVVICVVLFAIGSSAYYGLGRDIYFQKMLMKFQKFDLASLFTPKKVVPSDYKKIEIFNNDIKRAIDEHEVISFDIFAHSRVKCNGGCILVSKDNLNRSKEI